MTSNKVSRLPQLTSLKEPVTTTARKRPASDEFKHVEKKLKKIPPEKGAISRMPPPVRRPVMTRLRRSVSMANVAPNNTIGIRRQISTKKIINRNCPDNALTRQSNVTHSLISKNRQNNTAERRPTGNITNRINNVNFDAAQTEQKVTKGKSKRPAWDVKGRLIDMELVMKENTAKLASYDVRMASVEKENQVLSQNLEFTNTQNETNEQEVLNLKKELREARDAMRDMELDNNSLKNKNNNINVELTAKTAEATSLHTSVAQLVSSNAGWEAEVSATKLINEKYTQKVTELTEISECQEKTINELNEKLMDGESARRILHNTVQELKGNIRVYCRVRPLLKDEVDRNGRKDVIPHINFIDEKSIELLKTDSFHFWKYDRIGLDSTNIGDLKSRGNYEFKFDRIFTPREEQAAVFEEISQLVQSALDGYNVCVFAYGQTGSGKTFTMEGVYEDIDREGMIPRSVRQIFESIEKLNVQGWSYKVEASFLEIYNETIRDLLASPRQAKNNSYDIKLADGKTSEVYVSNLKIVEVSDIDTVHHLLNTAQQHRAVAATNLNERSSRSHSVFRLKLRGENIKTSESREGTLNLIDLAGSERLKNSGSEGARLTETQNINKSLANLSNVILALGQKQNHIPYRNSKLTHLLQNSLGGNSKTLMLVAISPLNSHFSESVNTLRFAVKVNQCHIGTATRHVKR